MGNLPQIKDVVDCLKLSPTSQSPGELRFGNKGSLSVNTHDQTWWDFENGDGGGVLDFIVHNGEASDRSSARQWCKERGLIADEPSPIKPVREHIYRDPDGNPVSKAVKYSTGKWTQKRFENGGWLYGTKGVRRYPYGADRLTREDASKLLFIFEGEKDCERAWQHGLSATTNVGGAGKWRSHLNDHITGRTVCIVPDNDAAGANHATKVAASLERSQIDNFILDYAAGLPEKADFSDWMDANGNDAKRFLAMAEAAKELPREPVKPIKKILTMIGDIEIKEPEYLIDETIETKTLAALVGPSGSGKTFVAIDLAMSVATGTPYHGNEVQKGLVIMSAGEGHSGIPRRVDAWLAHYGKDTSTAALALTSRAVDLFDEAYQAAFCSEIDAIAKLQGAPKLIIIDTVARHMGGLDENASRDMGALIATADKLKDDYGCVVLLVHHTGHANPDRARGSTAFKGALDTEILVKPLGEHDLTTSCEKQKDGAPFPTRQFLKVTVGQSLILQQVEAAAKSRRKITAAEQYALDSLSGTFDEIGRATAHVEEWRPNFYAGHPADSLDAKRKAFNRARQALINRGFVECNEDKYSLRDSGT
jgi:hypothetical protein